MAGGLLFSIFLFIFYSEFSFFAVFVVVFVLDGWSSIVQPITIVSIRLLI